VSDYDWGWAPFHYGRWVFIDGRGWSWIPGREYRGAWVSWGVDDGYGYVGWYPMMPAYLWFGGVGMAYSFGIGPRWNYCGRGEIFSPVVGTRLLRGQVAVAAGARVHAMPSVNGMASRSPEPSKLGFSAAQVPHATGAGAQGIAKAQQFSRASTATAQGARPPSHAATASTTASGGRPSLTSAGTTTPNHAQPTAQTPQKKKPTPEPQAAPHASHGGHGGGGHHR